MVLTCMLNNPSAKLICPQQVIDSLSENETIYNKIKERIKKQNLSNAIKFSRIRAYFLKMFCI